MTSIGKYIYCFINEKEKKNFGMSTIGGFNSVVYSVIQGNIAAIVSDVPNKEYTPTRKNLMSHQAVLQRLMENYSIIPVAFGTVANNRSGIEKLIYIHYEDFNEQLQRLNGKVEFGVKVTWNNDYFDIDIQNERIKRLKEKVSGKAEEKVLTEKITLGKLVEASIKDKREDYLTEIFNPLSEIASESKYKEELPIKTVLIGYFLVDKEKEKEFDEMVARLTAVYKDKLVINYTGPWAPYNFVTIHIESKDFS